MRVVCVGENRILGIGLVPPHHISSRYTATVPHIMLTQYNIPAYYAELSYFIENKHYTMSYPRHIPRQCIFALSYATTRYR
jgi:hypothetical protein